MRTELGICLLLAIGMAVRAQPTGTAPLGEDRWVVRAHFENPAALRALVQWRAPWTVDPVSRYVVLDVNAEEEATLIRLGFRPVVDRAMTARYRAPFATETEGSGIPGFPCYATVEETYALAESLTAQFPDLVAWLDIGDSWEKTQDPDQGFDIGVLRLTNQQVPGPKPALFAMSAVHARELATAGLLTAFAEHLVQNYGVDADVTWILDHHEVHLVLQSNPDGRIRAETGLLWRKNADNDFCTGSNLRGIDLNRNFSFLWACCGGGSNSECSEVFRGPSAGSEPEIQAIQNYVRSIFPDQREDDIADAAPLDATGVFLDIHSFGEVLLWPYGFTATPAPNTPGFQALGRKLAFHNDYLPLPIAHFTTADGDSADFAYGELGVAAFGLEIGNQFFEDCNDFQNRILPDNLAMLLYAAKVARTPYLTPSGPDTYNVTVSVSAILPGETATLSAIVDDDRFNDSNGVQPVQNIAAAEYYMDVPPWALPEGLGGIPLQPTDGFFDSPQESVEATLSGAELGLGRYSIFVRGQDADNRWGAVSAVFLEVIDLGALLEIWPDPVTVLDLVTAYESLAAPPP